MNNLRQDPEFHQWLVEPLPPEVASSISRLARADDVQHLAIMPDVHLAEDVCVGVVLATSQLTYPAAVGGDIGCGMAAIAFESDADVIANDRAAAAMLTALYQNVPGNRHRRQTIPAALPPELAGTALSHPQLEALKRRDGLVQLGTLGRGNHFLELQADEYHRLWLMIHSGSRAIGQAVRDHHLSHAVKGRAGLAFLDTHTERGKNYLIDAAWARRYAASNRRWMVDAVIHIMRNLFRIDPVHESFVDCDHNHVELERHHDRDLIVHRKGAAPAFQDQPGIIPGSMGTHSYHTSGRGHPDSLCSSSHGAGRAMSRDFARRTVSARDLHRQLEGVWFDHRAAARLREEAPAAYKDIGRVMRAQRDLTRIRRKLRPILSYKAT